MMRSPHEFASLDGRYRTMLILWFALLSSIGMFFVLTFLAPSQGTENLVLTLAFLSIGLLAVVASYFIKRRFLAQAVEKQDISLVQTGLIVAASLCEASALMGVMDHFVTGHRHYYIPMILGVIGSLLNFPRREHLIAASYKKDLS